MLTNDQIQFLKFCFLCKNIFSIGDTRCGKEYFCENCNFMVETSLDDDENIEIISFPFSKTSRIEIYPTFHCTMYITKGNSTNFVILQKVEIYYDNFEKTMNIARRYAKLYCFM